MGMMADQRSKDLAVDPHSQLVEMIPGCNDVTVEIYPYGTEGEGDHQKPDTFSDDENLVLEDKEQRKRRRSKQKRHGYIVSEAKAPKLRPAGGTNV
ncbi:MAG: hypothetical protein AUG51_14525 [Acidobacteria bacterium 13_1_20CM_3_53_8]|nr:MAG: hypothetical protein AUG51_14525 [Acidobacteria bacterium 13_1_20CM_3_53_8]